MTTNEMIKAKIAKAKTTSEVVIPSGYVVKTANTAEVRNTSGNRVIKLKKAARTKRTKPETRFCI